MKDRYRFIAYADPISGLLFAWDKADTIAILEEDQEEPVGMLFLDADCTYENMLAEVRSYIERNNWRVIGGRHG